MGDSPHGSKSNLKECNVEEMGHKQNVDPSNIVSDTKKESLLPESHITGCQIFSKDYFIKYLQEASAIETEAENIADLRSLLKVVNITVGLVMAAIGTGWFSDLDVIKWIR